MKGILVMLALVATAVSAKAEWYVVTKVHAYNTVELQLSEGHGSKSGIIVRVQNLEKIEYIKNDRSKVLLSGKEPKQILEDVMKGQIVWIDEILTVNGEKVASIYLSYEQVLKAFTQRQMSGQYTITPQIKAKVASVYKRMVSLLKSASPDRDNPTDDKAEEQQVGKAYENDYTKALFVYDSLDWFKKTGQFLPVPVQELYIDWVSDYVNAGGNDARNLEIKVIDMRKRNELYRDFLLQE